MAGDDKINDSKPMNGGDKKNDFKLERLKFLLQQIDRLNERFHKYVMLFQTLATAIIGAGATVFVFWTQAGISAEAARTTVRSLLALFVLMALFVIVFIVTGVISWIDYRKEEVRVFNDVLGEGYRSPPNLRNLWRWHESYLLLVIILSTFGVVVFTEWQIVPLIK